MRRALAGLFACLLPFVAGADEGSLLAVQPDQVERLWTPVRQVPPKVPFTFSYDPNLQCTRVETGVPIPWQRGSRPGFCGSCAAVGYVIEADGRTSSLRLLRVVPAMTERRADAMFAHVLQAIRRWRFEPTALNAAREPVYTWFAYALVLEEGITDAERDGAWAALHQLCEIARFP
jgi:hypothetical protein